MFVVKYPGSWIFVDILLKIIFNHHVASAAAAGRCLDNIDVVVTIRLSYMIQVGGDLDDSVLDLCFNLDMVRRSAASALALESRH
jgi:hypothetical protein